MYRKPNSLEIRKMSNAFGVMKNVTMMKIRERTTKIILMDYVNYLINEKNLTPSQVMNSVNTAIDKAIEKGFCTEIMRDKLVKFVNKKCNKIDPLLKLHYAVTMEVLDETDNTLPKEIEEASECGPECFGDSRPSIENFINNSLPSNEQLYRNIGGTLCNQVLKGLQDSLNKEYLSVR